MGAVDSTQIGYNDMDSKLFSRQTNVILLITHHSLYLIQILIGLTGLVIPFGQIYFWIIYVSLATINGFFLLIFTLSGLVFFALPVIFSIIDISNSCYMCFILEAYEKNNLIYLKSLTESSSNLPQTKGSTDQPEHPSSSTGALQSASVNCAKGEQESGTNSLCKSQGANCNEVYNKTNEASIDAVDGEIKSHLSSKLNYVTEAKSSPKCASSSSSTSPSTSSSSPTAFELNECFYVDKSQINLNGSEITSSFEEKIELQETSKLPSRRGPTPKIESISPSITDTGNNWATKSDINNTCLTEMRYQNNNQINCVNDEKGQNNLPFHSASLILHATSPNSSASTSVPISHGISDEFLSLSSNDLYFSSANSLESLNKISHEPSGPIRATNKQPETVINCFVKDAAIASSAV